MTSVGGLILHIIAILMVASILIVNFYFIEAVKVIDCTKGQESSGKLEKVRVAHCNMHRDPYCALVRGKNASIAIDFRTVKPFEAAIVHIYGKLGFITVPFPLQPNNSCGNYGVDCPAEIDDKQRLAITFPVLKNYPTLELKIQLKLTDEAKNPILCVELPIKISRQ